MVAGQCERQKQSTFFLQCTYTIISIIDGITFAHDDNKLLPFPMYIFFDSYSIYELAKQELQMQSPGILQLVKLLCVVRPCLWQKVAMHRAQ